MEVSFDGNFLNELLKNNLFTFLYRFLRNVYGEIKSFITRNTNRYEVDECQDIYKKTIIIQNDL